jgi:predicted esterase
MKKAFLAALFVLIFFAGAALTAADNNSTAAPLVKNFFEASDEDAVNEAIDKIVKSGADPAEVERLLVAGRSYPKPEKTGWLIRENKCADGRTRPFNLYIPDNYDPAKKYPVVIELHGGISRDQMIPIEMGLQLAEEWQPLAKELGFIYAYPRGQKGATWWDRPGIFNVHGTLEVIKREFNVDENKCFCLGFSDGSTGTYIQASFFQTKWAAFVALNGSYMSLRVPWQTYPRNLLCTRPIIATHGGLDGTFPSADHKLYIEQLQKMKVDIRWTEYPLAAHQLDMFQAKELPKIKELFSKQVRNTMPKRIVWECSNPEVGRCDWLSIDEIADVGKNKGFENDCNIIVPDVNISTIGFGHDPKFSGPGMKVIQVGKGTYAEAAGLQTGDVIIKINGVTVSNLNTVADAKKKMEYGKQLVFDIERNGKKMTIKTTLPKPTKFDPYFPRTAMTGSIEALVNGNNIDVTVRNVAKFTVFVNRKMFDVSKPIVVKANGEEVFNAAVVPDLKFMLEQTAVDRDRSMVYCGKITVTFPKPAPPPEEKPEEDSGEKKDGGDKEKENKGWK